MGKKVCIINPNLSSSRRTVMQARHRPPLDLAYIASLLRGDFDVRLVDAQVEGMDISEMAGVVRQYAPDLLITTTTPVNRWECPQSYVDSFFVWLNAVGQLPSRPVIIVTGTHGTTQPDWLLKKCPSIDYVVRGEPERTSTALVRALAAGGDGASVAGVSYREGARFVHNPPAPRITDPDALPFPAYDLLPMAKYRYTFGDIPQPFSIVLASRGCPFSCTFCCRAMMEGAHVSRSPENVYAELKLLAERFGVRGVFFQDWEFTINKPFVTALTELLKHDPLGIVWGCNARANDFRVPGLFEQMKSAGCVRVNIGFESGSPEVLEAVKKRVTVDDLALAITVSRKLGLKLGMYALLNAPGETAATIRQTMQFLRKQGISAMNFNVVVPYFGTDINRELLAQLGPEAAKRVSWDNIEDYAGRVRTQLPPKLAKLYQRHVKFSLRYGRGYIFRWRFLRDAITRFSKA
ncbi:MAG: radical SAM protein [Patescibacteria group bacterium]|nr:radical SAM protein [Patescibacteria group bacterium]